MKNRSQPRWNVLLAILLLSSIVHRAQGQLNVDLGGAFQCSAGIGGTNWWWDASGSGPICHDPRDEHSPPCAQGQSGETTKDSSGPSSLQVTLQGCGSGQCSTGTCPKCKSEGGGSGESSTDGGSDPEDDLSSDESDVDDEGMVQIGRAHV